jgi:mono/diheme cytochrome c family protein
MQINNGAFQFAIVPSRRRPVAKRFGAAMMRPVLPLLATLLTLTTPALAASPSEQRGKTFALNNCARCHAVDRVNTSPLKIARRVARRRHTDRPPDHAGVPDQIHDLLSYMKSLE